VSSVATVSWYVAGTIAIGSVMGWLWADTRYIDEQEVQQVRESLEAQHTTIIAQLNKMQLDTAKRAVRFWKGEAATRDLNPTEMEMLAEQEQFVIHFQAKVLSNEQ